MRIIGWNIRAGGGGRAAGIVAQLAAWAPDVVVLGEFRGTLPSAEVAAGLADLGLAHQRQKTNPELPAVNGLLIASRWPLRPLWVKHRPADSNRWDLVAVEAPRPFALGAMHVPNEVTGLKWPFLEQLTRLAEGWRRGPALLIGDTNSGRPVIDEENPVFRPRYGAWFDRMERAGWADGFRRVHSQRREFTWYSPNGHNGFRIDQAFVNRQLQPRLLDVRHAWGVHPTNNSREALSDHAAIVVEFLD